MFRSTSFLSTSPGYSAAMRPLLSIRYVTGNEVIAEAFVEFHDPGDLDFAPSALRGPEIEQDHIPAKAGERHRAARGVGEPKDGCWLAHAASLDRSPKA